jgi:hypothetical protein
MQSIGLLADAFAASPSPSALKDWLECLLYIVGVGVAVAWIIDRIRGPKATPPNEQLGVVTVEIVRRIDGHDKEITNLWNTMRTENTAIRKDQTDQFNSIALALGRIEGQLDAFTKRKDK